MSKFPTIRSLWVLAVAFAFGLALNTVSLAQVSKGVILGTVSDQTGAVMPGAEVEVTAVGTGVARVMVTGEDGNYRIVNLDPGEYSVRAMLPGFKPKTVQGIILQVDQRARIDVELEVGEVADEVTVQGVTPIIATDQATVGEVIEREKVLELPLNGRQFLQLAELTPGVQRTTVGYMEYSGGSISANGMSDHANNTMVDGVMNQESGAARMNFSPSIDLIQEFKIQTNVYDSEFGRSGGAQINIVTKRGSLDYHGAVYMFHRNDNHEARNFFARRIPEFRRSQFGGSFGGHIPGSENDFFFFNYEGQRAARGLTVPISVPTPEIRNGDFSSLLAPGANCMDHSNNKGCIYDPATLDPATGMRQPFPNNIIPNDRITQQAKFINQFFPDPTQAGFSGNYVASPDRIRDKDQYSIRYDRDFSDSDAITFRFTYQDRKFLEPQPRGSTTPLVGFRQNQDLNGENHKLGWTHTFSPTTINSFNFGFSQYHQIRDNETTLPDLYVQGGSRGAVTGPEFFAGAGITGVAPERQQAGIPTINISGWRTIADDTFAPLDNPYNNYVYSNTLNKVQGNHSWKVGIEVIRNAMDMAFEANSRGIISFSPRFSVASIGAPGDQFNAWADYLLGAVTSSGINGALLQLNTKQTWWMFFLQDDWHVHPDLTLNLGMRYEIWQRPYDAENRITGIDIASGQWVFAESIPTLPGTPSNAVTNDAFDYDRSLQKVGGSEMNDWGPRVGLAWRLFGDNKTVLRGGYGVFYSWQVLDIPITMGLGRPWVPPTSIASDRDVPAISFGSPFGTTVVPATGGRGLIRDNRTPYLQQYSLSLDRELLPTMGVEVAYVGNAGRKNVFNFGLNNPYPGPEPTAQRRALCRNADICDLSGISGPVNWGTSNYNALQVKLRKEMGPEGLMLLGAYSWGKVLGTSIAGPQLWEGQPIRDWNRNWKADTGPTRYDTRHLASLSWVYQLPFGRGKPLGGDIGRTADLIFGGWKLGGIGTFQTGAFLTPRDIFNVSNAGGSRPDLLRNPNNLGHSSRDQMINQFFNTGDRFFARTAPFTFGNAGTGTIVGPGLQLWDISLHKDFYVAEEQRVQFRVELFNAFNHVNFGNPNTSFGSASFGRIRNAGDARQVQFGLRYDF